MAAVVIALTAMAPVAGATPAPERSAATPRAAATAVAARQVGPDCNDYIPRDLALSVPSAAPGQTITITGLAAPGDTVTIRIATLNGPPIILGTATADANGQFSAEITIPADFDEGTYNITVSSPLCAGVSTITIVVTFPQGRCVDRRRVLAQRGDDIDWELLGILDDSKPLTVLLVPVNGGPSVVVFTGPYPGSGEVAFTVPGYLANGVYRIVESGTGPNGGPRSARCGRLVVRGGGGSGSTTTTTTTTTPGGSSTTSTTVPGTDCPTTTQFVEFDGTRLIDFDGFNPKVEYTGTSPLSLPAGTHSIINAVSQDGYPGRASVGQFSEVWEIEFLDAGSNVVGRSAPTPDLEDFVQFAEWSGPLGEVTLSAPAVAVRAHHLPDLFPDGPDGPANSVNPISFTICEGDIGGGGGGGSSSTSTSTTTIAGGGGGGATSSTTTSTTVPAGGDVLTPTGVLGATASNQVNEIGSNPTRVAGSSVTRQPSSTGSGLAFTGASVRPFIVSAVALIAAGALIVLGARRRT